MPESSIINGFLIIIFCFIFIAIIAAIYTFLKSFLLLKLYREKHADKIDGLDISGWNTFHAIKLVASGICDDDPKAFFLKRSIRVSYKIMLLSLLCCFIAFVLLGLFVYRYG